MLFIQALLLPVPASTRPATPDVQSPGARSALEGDGEYANAAGPLSAALAADSFGIVLTPLTTAFNGHTGIDHQQSANRLIVTANSPAGQPHNFELIAADGAHTTFSNVAGLSGGPRLASARDDGQGRSRGGFAPGETFAGTGAPGGIARVSPDGSTVQNPWVTLPGETGLLDGGLYVDRADVFGGDLVAVTTSGGVWRINAAGQPALLTNLGTPLEGVTTVPSDPDRYGPWAGKILVGAPLQGTIYTIDLQGNSTPYPLGVNPTDLRLIPAHENFYGVDTGGGKLWGAPDTAFTGMIGDVLVAQGSPGTLTRVRWNGASFDASQIAQVVRWEQITFSPAGAAEIPAVRRAYDKIAVVRHAPELNSGRVEGALWQLSGESVTFDGTDVITSDLLVPGSPAVHVSAQTNFGGTVEGPDGQQPTNYEVTITGNATLRHLITRTGPVQLEPVAAPPAPAGTRDVSLQQAGAGAGDWATVRNLTLGGRAGAVAVPPGTYGRFSAGGRTALVFGVAGSAEPGVYNLESLTLSGGSELRLAGPVVLTVKGGVSLTGSTVGAADDPRRMLLRMPEGELRVGGGGVLYGVVRAPQSLITIEGTGRLRGTVSCDRLAVNGDGVLQITESDIPPPPVNRPPVVDAGGDQAITLPAVTVRLQGAASDDGFPQGGTLTTLWGKVSGPGTVSFSDAGALATTATFGQAGTYVLRLTASDTLLTDSDEVTVTVTPRNQPPTVNAGGDQVLTLPAAAALAGTVTDDGLPHGSPVTVAWSVVEGPGAVVFSDPNSAATTASFAAVGAYTLRLTASDAEFTASDDVVITVNSVNLPPAVNAGPDQMITPPNNTIRLNGTATDDGRPEGVPFNVTWSQVSGPVQVSFGDAASAVTTATFNDQGTYVLRLTASDSQFTVSDEVEVVVGCPDNLKNLDVVLVIDRSGSMEGQRIVDAKAAAKRFIDNLQLTVDQVGVVTFAGTGRLDQPLTHDGARAKAAADAILTEFTGTNIGAGITVAKNELTSTRHSPSSAPIMIVLSDGENNAGDPFGPAALAKAAGIRVISIGIAEAVPADMRRLASTPTDFYFAPTSEDLDWIYAVIAGSICRNRAPLVRAGDDQQAVLPNTLVLNGEAHDDGLPANGRLTSVWSLVSGPAEVNFFDAAAPVTTAVFSRPGTYVLRLSATDTIATSADEVTVTVLPEPSLEGATLTLASDRPGSNVVGTQVTLTASLQGTGGPVANFPVLFNVTGPNAASGTALTDASGVATFSYTGTNTGTDTAQALADGSTFDAASNTLTQEWTAEPPGPTPTPTPTPTATQGWVGGPLNGSTLTGVVPVTLGAGVTLTSGRVEYCTVATPAVCTLLSGSAQGGPGTTVATFDTTLVANGSYTIRLSGTDAAGQQLLSVVLVTVVGDNKPGRMALTVDDLTVPVAGLPIKIGRAYDSLERSRVRDFGFGWSLSSGSPRLEVSPSNDVTLTEPGTGRRVTFKFTPRSFPFPVSFWYYPSYTPEAGTQGKLASDGCGLMLRYSDGFRCFFGEPYRPTAFTYTDRYGRVYTMTADGSLRTIKDLSGNTLTFTPAGITSSAGDLSVPFVRDAQGRITQITDPTGRIFRYNYDAAGDLSTVNLPGVTTAPAYTYDPSHLLLTAKDARGNDEARATYTTDGRLASLTDPAGNLTRFEYNLAANTTTRINPDNGFSVERYDAAGLLTNVTDPLGRTRSYTYDANRNKLTETDELGRPTRYTYDAGANLTSITDPLGRTARATYNQFGQPVTDTDRLGNVRTVLYDANSSPTAVSDGVGNLATYTYDRFGNVISQTDGDGAATHYTYDQYGNRLTKTDALGRTTTYTYDLMGRVLSVTDPRAGVTRYAYDPLGRLLNITDALNRVTRFEYDGSGNRTAQIDALGRRTAYVYDAANRLTRVTYPNNTFVTFTYNYRDQKLTATDQAGRTAGYSYDLAGQLTKVTHPGGAEETFTYDGRGRRTSTTDERGNTTTFEYEGGCGCSDRVTKITDPTGRATRFSYDAAGRRVAFIDANNRETRYSYDARHRLTQITYADGTAVKRTYDGANRPRTLEDQAGRVTKYAYDEAGNLTSVTDARNRVTAYAYDTTNNLLTQTDANNRTTRFEYDRLHRRTRRTLPLGQFETYTYDAVGNLATRTDFNGKRTTYGYDTLRRLLSKTPDATLGEPAVTFTYTPSGRRATMTDASGTTTYAYDGRDRLASKQTPQGTLTYTYDAANNLLTTRSSNPNGTSVDYAYDALNRLETVTDNRLAQGTTAYAYDAAGNLAGDALPNGVQSAYSYNGVNRLTDLTVSRGAALASYAYTLAPTGLRLSVTEQTGRTTNFGYDELDRLVTETVAGAPDPAQDGAAGYTLDPVGNRLARASTLPGLPAASAAYDANDRLSMDSYDANGNTTAADGRAFAYDFENRVKSVDGGAVTIVYDGDGNRVAKTVGGVTTRYLVDDRNPTGYAQVLEELVGGQVRRVYTYGNAPVSQSRLDGGVWRDSFYGYDGGGSVRFLTDDAGAVTDTYDYDAFGNLLARTGATPNNYLYRGEQFDPDLGLYFLRARYYDQRRGRFISMDPFEGIAGDPPSLHKYLYVGADPVNNIDPSGLAETFEKVALAGALKLALIQFALITLRIAVVCVLTLTAFAVLGFTIPDPAVPCTAKRPPDDDDFEEVTVYRGIKGTSPSEFKRAIDEDGMSTYEVLYPADYKFFLPFRVRFKKPKVPGVSGEIINSPIPGARAVYTPHLGDPTVGVGHWSIQFPGMTLEQIQQTLSKYAKSDKIPPIIP